MKRVALSNAAAAVAVLTCLCPFALTAQTRIGVPDEALRQSTAILRNGRVARPVVSGTLVTLEPGDLITSRIPVAESLVQRADTVEWRLPYRIEGLTGPASTSCCGTVNALRRVVRVHDFDMEAQNAVGIVALIQEPRAGRAGAGRRMAFRLRSFIGDAKGGLLPAPRSPLRRRVELRPASSNLVLAMQIEATPELSPTHGRRSGYRLNRRWHPGPRRQTDAVVDAS